MASHVDVQGREAAIALGARLAAAGFAALLGAFILFGVGFAHPEAIHEAAHDFATPSPFRAIEFEMLRRLLTVSLAAGAAAGALATIIQAILVTPLILEAETFEVGAAHGHAHAAADFGRFAFTALANLLAGVGFALLLNAAITLRGHDPSVRGGVIWGLAGFAVFSLAPALGLPPELPGAAAGDLAARQLWWLGAAAATAAGLALVAFGSGWMLRVVGVLALALPHLLGAPSPESPGGSAPPELAAHFAVLSLAAAAAFWAALGGLSGLLRARLQA